MSQHITTIISSPRKLPVKQRTDFKTFIVVCEAINGLAPCYIVDMLTEHTSERLLTSSNNGFLTVPRIYLQCAHEAFSNYCATR